MKNTPGRIEEVEIDGILVPSSWSEGNRVMTIAIHTAGELEYQIDFRNKTGKELKNYLGKRVIIKGHLQGTSILPKGIVVQTYKIIDW